MWKESRRTAQPLDEVSGQTGAVSLHAIESGKRLRKGADRAEIVYSAVVHREYRSQRQIIEVHAEFRVVAPQGPGKIIGELIALFHALNVGVRLAAEVSEARNVDGRIRPARNLRVVVVRESAPRILEGEFIHLVVADGPGVFGDPGHIAIGRLRGARKCVLSEGLILAAALDSSDRAGTDVGAQRQAVVVVDVVVEPQRIQTGAFKNREIPRLCSQRLIGSRNEARCPGCCTS